jgi:AraC family transcriptional regulator
MAKTVGSAALSLSTIEDSPGECPNRSERHDECSAMPTDLPEILRAHRPIYHNGTRRLGGLAAWQQYMVAAYIEKHLTEPIRLRALANLVYLSSSSFWRAFKRTFGVTPRRYHLNRRMARAIMLLADPAWSVKEIGLALGFGKPGAFLTAFRRATGTDPTTYRRNLDVAPGRAAMEVY